MYPSKSLPSPPAKQPKLKENGKRVWSRKTAWHILHNLPTTGPPPNGGKAQMVMSLGMETLAKDSA